MGAPEGAVLLHVGGLTTGAEDFVVYLAANRAGLRRAGFGLSCFDPSGVGPESLGPVMPEPGADDAAIVAAGEAIARKFGPDRKVGSEGFIISAPDLAGPATDLMLGRFHPSARMRARALRLAIGQPVDRLVLTIQPYTELFHSTWLMLAVDRPMEPFMDYADAMHAFQGGWADLAQVLVEELEVRELVVVAEPASPRQLLLHLRPGLLLRQPVVPLPKPRATPSAVAMLQRCIMQGMRLQPGQHDRLIAFHARQPQVRSESVFSSLALSDLRGRYVADLDTLAAMAGTTLIGAEERAMAAE